MFRAPGMRYVDHLTEHKPHDDGCNIVFAYLPVFDAGGEGEATVTRARRRRIVRDLILAIVIAVGVVAAVEILIRIWGWL